MMLAAKHKHWVLETIDCLRQRKARPDFERISRMVHRLHGITAPETQESLNSLLHEGTVIKVLFKGNVSYRHIKRLQKRSIRGNPLHHQVYDSSTRIIQALRMISKHKSQSDGVTFNNLQKWLVDKNPDTRLVKHRLENALKKVLDSGAVAEVSDRCYMLTEQLQFVSQSETQETKSKVAEKSVSSKSVRQKQGMKLTGSPAEEKEMVSHSPEIQSETNKLVKEQIAEQETKHTVSISIKQGMKHQLEHPKEYVQAGLKQTASKEYTKQYVSKETKTSEKSLENSQESTSTNETSVSAPHARRGRPLSKRKKFRKTHGPDFESSIGGKGRGLSNKDEERTCDFCSGTQEANAEGEPESLLSCIDCSAKAHPSCMNYTSALAQRALNSPWQCMDCKTCCVCDGSENADLLLFCDACDKGYHTTCHNPVLMYKPKGTWVCRACKQGTTEGQSSASILQKASSKDDPVHRSGEEEENTNVRMSRRQRLSRQKSEPEVKRHKRSPSVEQSNLVMDCEDDKDSERLVKVDTLQKDYSVSGNGASCLPTPTASPRPADTFNYEMRMSLLGAMFPVSEDTTLYSDASSWDIDQVHDFFCNCGFKEQASAFREQEIDGTSLLLMKRNDVLTGLGLKLGPALKIQQKIYGLQKYCQSHS